MESPHKSFRLSPPPGPQVGIPRRFGIGTMMILVAVFAMLFSLLKTLGVPPVPFGCISIFVAGVAACQVLLFGGNNPRAASVVGGSIIFYAMMAVCACLETFGPHDFTRETVFSLGGALNILGFGGLLGYLVGGLLAAIFLVRKEPKDDPPTKDTSGETPGIGLEGNDPCGDA
ncbi:MAG: hypothetical protein LLG00_04765 [Planctomycetaceae bacterium]|nr:hypothetical protein [Planctomycetaceae bacterium]